MTEKLRCARCRKVLVEMEDKDELKAVAPKSEYWRCPHCSYKNWNPYY